MNEGVMGGGQQSGQNLAGFAQGELFAMRALTAGWSRKAMLRQTHPRVLALTNPKKSHDWRDGFTLAVQIASNQA